MHQLVRYLEIFSQNRIDRLHVLQTQTGMDRQ